VIEQSAHGDDYLTLNNSNRDGERSIKFAESEEWKCRMDSTVTLCTMYSTILDRYKSMFDVTYSMWIGTKLHREFTSDVLSCKKDICNILSPHYKK